MVTEEGGGIKASTELHADSRRNTQTFMMEDLDLMVVSLSG